MEKAFIYKRKSTDTDDKQVLSLDSQANAIQIVAKNYQILQDYEESKSAKVPGRPLFNEMVERLYKGEAKIIICWALNRLARNPIDGASIVWLVQKFQVEVVTPSKTYGIDDLFLMQIEFGISNQFIQDLKKVTLRGLYDKIRMGKFPGRAPLGYLNDTTKKQGERDILIDSERFQIVRKLWDMLLTGKYTPPKILEIATNEFGLRQRSGQPLSRSKIYELFENIFYTGKYYVYAGVQYDNGVHQPMITLDEYNKAQKILHRKGKIGVTQRDLAYNGAAVHCICGSTISCYERHRKICPQCHKKYNAEQNIKCPSCETPAPEKIWEQTVMVCNRKRDQNCKQPSVDEADFNKQLDELLSTLTIPQEFIDWTMRKLRKSNEEEVNSRTTAQRSLQAVVSNATRTLDNLELKFLSDENKDGKLWSPQEFAELKKKFQFERDSALQQLQGMAVKQDEWLETAELALNFARHAQEWFNGGTNDQRRSILLALGANPILDNKKLHIDLLKPIEKIQEAQSMLNDGIEEIEPTNKTTIKPQIDKSQLENPVWGD